MRSNNTVCAERRRFPRVPLSYQIQIHSGDKAYWVIAINLGFGGAFIETDAPLSGNERFTLSLNCVEGGSATEARVAWRNGTGFGIEFIDPSVEFVEQVRVLVEPAIAA